MVREGERANTGGGRSGAGAMRKRRATMEDGRYLIYYTFGEGDDGTAAGSAGEAARAPKPEPQAEDERSV